MSKSRYIIAHSSDFDEDTQHNWGKDCWYLIEVGSNSEQIVWSDMMEPEDATLSRDLGGLVSILNKRMEQINFLIRRLEKGSGHLKAYNELLRDFNERFKTKDV